MRAIPKSYWLVPLALLLIFVTLFVACGKGADEAGKKYHCPMHPTYIADRPGDCPICGMRLVEIDTKEASGAAKAYVCPMHPEVTSDKPGKCSKCGMDLVAAKAPAEGSAARGDRKIIYYRSPMDPSITSPVPAKDEMGMDFVPVYSDEVAPNTSTVEGMANVQISAQGIQLAGVQTAEATRERLSRNVRTVGVVMPNETLIRHVHTKISGWIEKLFVNFTGQVVRRGEPILTIYSPDLVATQEEFLRALQAVSLFGQSETPEIREGSQDLLAAARRRLELFDVPQSFILELERSKTPLRTVTLDSPATGFVTGKEVFEGKQVEPGMELFTITDLSRIWIEADFYEYEARLVRVGQEAVLTLPYDPSMRLTGRVEYIVPYLDPESRTLKVRFGFPNQSFALKPAMFANVELLLDGGEGIVIPDSAVMDTGERRVVFVDRGDGSFEPREVKVGSRISGKAQILSGVAEGERVVVRANFLLDSESRLRAGIAAAEKPATTHHHAGEKQ
ncbi:MAG: efflux RND transporter periplasmic adaptor subunit [Acidobacteria bacterium]|nr:efflux RND transporter periplasmic adaptor subunit [Acidobacteriota bacterium]